MPDEARERSPAVDRSPPPGPPEANGFGRWKPTIHWYTPILLLLGGLALLGVLYLIVRRLARSAEETAWGEDVRLREYRDPPPADSTREDPDRGDPDRE